MDAIKEVIQCFNYAIYINAQRQRNRKGGTYINLYTIECEVSEAIANNCTVVKILGCENKQCKQCNKVPRLVSHRQRNRSGFTDKMLNFSVLNLIFDRK